jgi:hypothetical protein
MEMGSAPRLATLLELTGSALQWRRPTMARVFLRILAAEIEAFSAATAR